MISLPHRRFVLTPSDAQQLPIIVESLGHNPNQEKIWRQDGYPYYHWIQTAKGEGTITIGGKTTNIPPHTGVLLFPRIPHSYETVSDIWETQYLTFGGPAVEGILASIGIREPAVFRWQPEAPLSSFIEKLLDRLESETDVLGLAVSSETYRFLITLSRYALYGNRTASAGNLDKIRTIVEWMESHYEDPGIGLKDIASVLPVSGRRLNAVFQETFGLSPYAYFIHLRIRKAKEMLIASSSVTVKEVAQKVGFRDTSHFVATFRKHVGMPPEQFRKLH